jgi:hypothetical protein
MRSGNEHGSGLQMMKNIFKAAGAMSDESS